LPQIQNSNACRFLDSYALKWYEPRRLKKIFRGSNFYRSFNPSKKRRHGHSLSHSLFPPFGHRVASFDFAFSWRGELYWIRSAVQLLSSIGSNFENQNSGQTSKFCQKLTFWSKIEILVKHRNLCQTFGPTFEKHFLYFWQNFWLYQIV